MDTAGARRHGGAARARRTTRRARLAVLAAAVVLALTVAGCSATAPAPTAPARAPSSAPAAPPRPLSPLTGLPADPRAPVFAVKVDNTNKGRPWDGVEFADVVYVEPVEGGLSRLLTVFSSRLPTSVGPVRSARESDVELLSAYGQPALVYSGAAAEIAPIITRAPVVSTIPDDARDAFRRSDARSAPENLYVDLRRLRGEVPEAAPARPIGFRFGPAPPGGAPTGREDVRVGNAQVGATWDAGARRWTVLVEGRPVLFGRGTPIQAATVIVQRVRTRPSAVRDVAGAVSPFAVTVGEGAAEILRDGRSFPARWSRPSSAAPTRFTGAGGDVPLAPGPVWVVLATSG